MCSLYELFTLLSNSSTLSTKLYMVSDGIWIGFTTMPRWLRLHLGPIGVNQLGSVPAPMKVRLPSWIVLSQSTASSCISSISPESEWFDFLLLARDLRGGLAFFLTGSLLLRFRDVSFFGCVLPLRKLLITLFGVSFFSSCFLLVADI